MDLIGKSTIHPILFYSGKIAGYLCWIIFVTSLLKILIVGSPYSQLFEVLSLGLALVGVVLVVVSLVNLGRSIRLGLPSDDTSLKITGLYQFSRNPMYLGFNLFTISAIFFTWDITIALAGIYSLIIYHFIILGEERFLKERFGEEYELYMKKVRRYL